MRYFLILLLISSPIFAFCQSPSPSQERKIDGVGEMKKTCSPVLSGLQYCMIPKSIPVKSGESVTVEITVQNMTKEPISFTADSFVNLYDVVITGPDDKKILSSIEILEKKQLDGTITPDEMGSLLPINSAPRKILLEPLREVKMEYNLNQFYDFKAKGKYCVEIGKKGEGPSFGKFEAEVNN